MEAERRGGEERGRYSTAATAAAAVTENEDVVNAAAQRSGGDFLRTDQGTCSFFRRHRHRRAVCYEPPRCGTSVDVVVIVLEVVLTAGPELGAIS